ncbi:PREDICTED: uncharacterized protein LOC104715140 [Camelina sativa]|uniref:Uncharacterized protein LOC104715140 n=1 Tax=Camelina sativa TaxID=90675 RepID=A0ABM0TT19_CAMSA|nr:PREDICTED: uncharacterized protein LOC104715140 [Camelina sativa]
MAYMKLGLKTTQRTSRKRCTRCRLLGHNWATCHGPIPELCMHTRSNKKSDLRILGNKELAQFERENRRARTQANPMADGGDTGANPPNPQLGIVQQQQRQNKPEQAPPAPTRQDYEIKHSLINLVQNRVFHGLPLESPLDHIEAFERLTSTMRSNGVPYDYLMLTLFQFSLADKAIRWLNLLDAGSLTTWAQCRAAFLNHFYTKSRSAKLQSKITTFSQGGMESFCEAWERFKEYLRDCPHHGYTQENMTNIFYGGIEQKYQMALNTASKGDFSSNTANEANALIKNLGASNSNHDTDYDRTVRVNSVETDAIKDLRARVNLLLKRDNQSVNLCEEQAGGYADLGAETYQEGTEEVNNMGGQGNFQNRGFYENFRNHLICPIGATMSRTPRIRSIHRDLSRATLHRASRTRKKNTTEVNVKIDSMYSELNGRIKSLNSHIRVLENQVAQSAARVKAPPGTLAGKNKANPKEYVNVITLRSGKNPDEVLNNTSDDVVIPGTTIPEGEKPSGSQKPYAPRLPFPTRRKTKIQDREYEKLKSVVGELQVRLPFIEAVKMVPSLKKYMKEILTDKLSLEKEVMYLTQECSSMLQN